MTGATVLFSSKAILIKLIYQQGVNVDTLMILRMLFAAPFYCYVAISAKRTYAKSLTLPTLTAIMATCFVGFYVASVLDLYGLQYIDANLERLIIFTYPAMVVLLSMVIFKRKIKPSLALCLGAIFVGLWIVFSNSSYPTVAYASIDTAVGALSAMTVGCVLVFASALAFAVYMIVSERMMRTIPSRLFTAYGMLCVCVAVCAHYLLRQPIELITQLAAQVYLLIAILAIFCTVLPSFLFSAGVQRIGAATASAIGSAGPMITLVLAFIVLGERITLFQLFGFAIIIGAIVILGKLKPSI